MGIQRLTTRILHKAERFSFKARSDDSEEEPRLAIIDGPSFAYHVYNRWLRDSEHHTQAIGISYEALNDALLARLHELESFGFEICHIFFDGALPVEKLPIRIQRLQKMTDQIVKIRPLYEQEQHKVRHAASLNSFLQQARRAQRLPAPAFLVSCMIQALKASEYGQITKVISGEAEDYCISAATDLPDTECYILTNDSDVMAARLAPHVKVLLLEHMELYSSSTELRGLTINPNAIAQSLGLQDLTATAEIMSRDIHRSLETAAAQAQSESDPAQKLTAATRKIDALNLDAYVHDTLQYCGARMAEIVIALLDSEAEQVSIFLPILLDDGSRASAWQCGKSFRQLAIDILLLTFPTDRDVQEYDRRGDKILPLKLKCNAEPLETARAFDQWLRAQTSVFGTTGDAWQAVGLIALLSDLKDRTHRLPAASNVKQVVMSRHVQSWSDVHLAAQWQATLYSITMLQTACRAFTARQKTHGSNAADSDLRNALQNLSKALLTLPTSAGLFDLPRSGLSHDSAQYIMAFCEEQRASLKGHSSSTPEGWQESVRPSKRQAVSKSKDKSSTANKTGNRYAMLTEDA